MLGRAAALLVAAVIVAAVVDALRRDDGEAEPARAKAAGALRELGVQGTLVYADRDCAVRAVRLPDLAPATPPVGLDAACSLSSSPDGTAVASGAARWRADGGAYAICRGARVHVVDGESGRTEAIHTGCAPSWRDGTLTVFDGRNLVEAESGRVLVSRRALRRAARRHPTLPDPPDALGPVVVRDAVWLSRDRVALLLRSSLRGRLSRIGPTQVLAFFDGGRELATFTSFRPMERLDASPDGRRVAAQPDTIVGTDGALVGLPPRLTAVRRLAWSPDGRRLAVATLAAVVFLEPDAPSSATVRVPLRVEDLAWR